MSITLMTAAFKAQLHHTHKFVLVALCDNANDQGECYPSVTMLCEKTSLSERTVQGAIAHLVTEKYLSRDMRKGRSTYYFISDPRTWCTPAADAPPQQMHPTPAADAPPPPQVLHHTPAGAAPITINEPSIEPSGNRHTGRSPKNPPAALPVLPDWMPMESWNGFADMRKRKGKPITERAQILIVKTLSALRDGGHDVESILDSSTVNSWTDVYAPKPHQGRMNNVKQSVYEQSQSAAARAKQMLFGEENETV